MVHLQSQAVSPEQHSCLTQHAACRTSVQQKRKALKAMQRKFAALQERLKSELAALDTTEARVRHLDGLRKVGSASSVTRHEAGAAPAVTPSCDRSAAHAVAGCVCLLQSQTLASTHSQLQISRSQRATPAEHPVADTPICPSG